MLETAEKTGKKKHDKNEREREDWRTVGELLINPLSFTQLAQSHGVSGFPAAWSLSDLQIFYSKSSRCRLLEYKQTFFWCCRTSFFYAYSSPYALRLLCFALFPRLSPWQSWQLGSPAKVLPPFYPLGRFERIKTVLMGTNTPHTFIPGLVWQKRAHPFSQLELKVGVTRISHSLCMCYSGIIPQGARGRHFPLRQKRSIGLFCTIFVLDKTYFVQNVPFFISLQGTN